MSKFIYIVTRMECKSEIAFLTYVLLVRSRSHKMCEEKITGMNEFAGYLKKEKKNIGSAHM